ncbi:hypothetical protein WOC76_22030 [Methylocystis sp. IM3]|uniref:hypothetical protein n=1 Tax=unclassified Methylocystis TaxID=2625913 RepID=UPI0030F6FA86
MKKKAAGLVSAISALAPVAAVPAPTTGALTDLMAPSSYGELLQPIPDASRLLNEAMAAEPAPDPQVQRVQYYGDPYYYPQYNYYYGRRWRYHHHHHNNYGWGQGWGPYYHHHHHHHHHHHDYYWRPY